MPENIPFEKKELIIKIHNPNNLPIIDFHKLKELQGDLKITTSTKIEKLKNSIIKYGVFVPKFTWIDNGICYIEDGHQTIKALTELEKGGYVVPPIPYVEIQATDRKDAGEKLLMINSRFADINPETSFFKDFDIGLEFMEEIEIPELELNFEDVGEEIVEDEVPEVPEEPVTQVGDLWLLGKHRVLCGDSTKAEDVERLIQGKQVDMLFTSPPYTDMRNYNDNKNLETNKLVEFIPLFSSVANYLVINLGIQRKDHEIVEYWQEYLSKAKENNYTFLSWNVWNKEEARSLSQFNAFFSLCHEWIFVFGHEIKEVNKTIECKTAGSKASGKYTPARVNNKKNKEDRKLYREYIVGDYKKLGTVITTDVSMDSDHPATFPLSLPSEYIKAMTGGNNIICDPFLGSGTTLIAAHQLNRICYGMEIEPKYIDVTCQRFFNLTGIDPVRESDGKKWSELQQ